MEPPTDHALRTYCKGFRVPDSSSDDEDTRTPSKIPKRSKFHGSWSARYGIIPGTVMQAGAMGGKPLVGCIWCIHGAIGLACAACAGLVPLLRDVKKFGRIRHNARHANAPWEMADELFAGQKGSSARHSGLSHERRRSSKHQNGAKERPYQGHVTGEELSRSNASSPDKKNQTPTSQRDYNDGDDGDDEYEYNQDTVAVQLRSPGHESRLSPVEPTSNIIPPHLTPVFPPGEPATRSSTGILNT